MDYILIRSNRKTVSMHISDDLSVVVKAPLFMSKKAIDLFVKSHENWAEEKIKMISERNIAHPEPDEETRKLLQKKARETILPLAERYAGIMGVNYTGIKITSAKKRFGSCSGKDSICFSWRLMMYPIEAVEYVVVHELAHIKHKNHSREFYAFIESVLPDYKVRQNLLRR